MLHLIFLTVPAIHLYWPSILRTYSNLKSDIKPTINFQDTQSWETAGHASGQVLVYLQKKR